MATLVTTDRKKLFWHWPVATCLTLSWSLLSWKFDFELVSEFIALR